MIEAGKLQLKEAVTVVEDSAHGGPMNLGTGLLLGVWSQGASVPGISPEASCLH